MLVGVPLLAMLCKRFTGEEGHMRKDDGLPIEEVTCRVHLGPGHPWATAVNEFDQLRAAILKLPESEQATAWGRLIEHVRAARAEILGPTD
ncbi:hypothetical protein P9869_12175 [Streptomyces ossamyceticus]|nr:hypothetical protein [Streptomyces ossamyceticus]